MRRLTIILILISLVLGVESCRTGTSKSNSAAITHFGNLDSIMAGYIKPVYSLDSLVAKNNLYALGAMDSLAGEIQIFNNQPFNSIMLGDSVIIGDGDSKYASLIVYAQVEQWRNISLPMSVTNQEAFIGFLQYDEELNEFETDKPFMFMIEGEVEQLNWHIIRKPITDSLTTHKDHRHNAGSGMLQNTSVEILGVYSTEHEGVFTHHNLPVHMHFKTSDGSLAGHVDEVEFGTEMRLRLPVKK